MQPTESVKRMIVPQILAYGVEITPPAPFDFDPTLHKPDHFPMNGLNTDQDEHRYLRQVAQLRACAGDYTGLHEEVLQKRLAWWEANHESLNPAGPLPRQAYTLLLLVYMGLDPREVPVVYEDERTIIWRSANLCPTLEACRRLGLDTRASAHSIRAYLPDVRQFAACIPKTRRNRSPRPR